mgnify:CR=1 FL=1
MVMYIKITTYRNLNFILLSDPEHKLAEAFNVWIEKSMYGRKYMGIERSTFVLDENLNVIKEWRKVKVKGHVDEVIDYLNT